MSYTKTQWNPGGPPGISAENLNKIEDGIEAAHKLIETDIHTPNQSDTAQGSGTLLKLQNYWANMLRRILGTTNWYDAPPTTLTAAKSHIDAAAPHSGHETPAGAQAKAEAAAEAAAGVVRAELDAHKAEKATQDTLGHIRLQDIPVTSVNGKTGEVVIDVGDIAGLVSNDLALGRNASAGGYSVALGSDASTGHFSVALGRNASATGHTSVAIGLSASAENTREGILGGTGINSTSSWKVPGSFTVSGTKNFEIPHPKPEKSATHVIRHGAVESPTPGDTLYRWRIQATKDNDLVTIDLPDYFVWLNKDVQVFVTPQGHFGNGYGELNEETEQLEIHCQFAGEYNVLVIGTRNDDHQSVQDWYIKGVEREIGESWTGETYAFSVDEIIEIEEIKEVSA